MSWHRYREPKVSRPHSSKLAERLAKKIKEQLDIECDPTTFRRTYAGYWQKSNGAFVWTMYRKDMPFDIGSCDPASICVRKDYRLTITDDCSEICAEKINNIQ